MKAPIDEHVGSVGLLLSTVATPRTLDASDGPGAIAADAALWLCPCYAPDDAPTWLLLHDADGLGWSRVPDEIDVETVVASEQMTGWHTEPFAVLQWLTGQADHPWLDGDEGEADRQVVDFFANALRDTRGTR